MIKKTTNFPKPATSAFSLYYLIFSLGIVFLLIAPVASGADETALNYNMGPALLEVSSLAPGQSFRYSPIPCVHEAIVPGQVHIRLGSSWANIFTEGKAYDLDYEVLHARFSVSYGVNERLQMTAAFEQRNFFGGGMDGLIIEFHDLFGIEQGGRTNVPRNVSHYLFRDAQGNMLADSDDINTFDNNNIQAEISYILSPGTRILPAVHLKGVVCRNLDSPLIGRGNSLDYSMGVGFSKRWSKKWLSYHNAMYSWFGRNESPYFTLSDNSVSIVNALVWQYRPRFSYLLQFIYADGMFENIPGLSEATHEAHLGFKWKMKSGGILEFAIIENVISYNNSPDFGIHLAYTYTPE